MRKRRQRYLSAVRRVDVDLTQAVRVLPEDWIHFHHHEILVHARVSLGDLPFAESVVENVVDRSAA